jgi:flagellar biosynthetic protein FlhB
MVACFRARRGYSTTPPPNYPTTTLIGVVGGGVSACVVWSLNHSTAQLPHYHIKNVAEENGDKTEAPTPRRRQRAEEEGNIARSQDLVAAALMVGAMLLLKYYGEGVILSLRTLMAEMLGGASLSDFSDNGALHSLVRAVAGAGRALAPLFIGLVLINPARLQPNLAALNPFARLGRLFGGRSPVQGAMTLVKFAIIAGVAYSALHDRLMLIITAQGLEFLQIFSLGAGVVYAVVFRIGVALLVLAILDYAWQRYRHEQDLKMSKQEVKDEMRSMDGDPKIKQRRRQIAIQIAHNKLKKTIPTADVVVTNPTEFAVALKYDPETMNAPRVIAKGQGSVAARIRQLAIESGVPILERKPLARALYKLVEVGQEVPEQFYAAIAEILAYVYELSGKNRVKREDVKNVKT